MMMWSIALCMVAMFVIYAFHRIFNNNSTNLKLPPGSNGLPFVGETLQLLFPSSSRDLHPYIRNRAKRYGPVFRTNIFGELVVISTDEEFNKQMIKEEGTSVELWLGPLEQVFLPGEARARLVKSDLIKYLRTTILSQVGPEPIKEKLLAQMEQIWSETFRKWSTQTSVEVQHGSANVM
ncbi:hypothetical protein PIB30_014893 [Stylosanthes scabra]|uniref:Cytochrome P450 n=1 Tax=Stylosanthes scabra TaxID=79078 RepID=A0ABU6U5N8_9FABA|nr:hypothetical protein [Stylosanthes scabra]